jgi:hypothetical protein
MARQFTHWNRIPGLVSILLLSSVQAMQAEENNSAKFLPNSSLLFGPNGLESTNAKPQYNFSLPAPVQYVSPAPINRTPPASNYAPAPPREVTSSVNSAPAMALPDQKSLSELDAMRQAAMQAPPAASRPVDNNTDTAAPPGGMDMNALKQAAQAMQATDSTSNTSGSASAGAAGIPGLGDLSKMGLPGDLGSLLQGLPEKIQKFNNAYKEVDKELQGD